MMKFCIFIAVTYYLSTAKLIITFSVLFVK